PRTSPLRPRRARCRARRVRHRCRSSQRAGDTRTPERPLTRRPRARSARGLVHDREGVVGAIQRDDTAVIPDDRDVFDAYAEAAGEVHPGLDRERHSGLEALLVTRDQIGMLVSVEADAMAGAVDEVLAEPPVRDDLPEPDVDR